MGPLIQIAARLFGRILIALVAWAFTFTGHNVDLKLYQSTSTPSQLNTSPLFVEINDRNVNVPNNTISTSTTKTVTTTPTKKIVQPVKVVKKPEANIPVKTPAPAAPPITPAQSPVENPSLKDLPVPTINLPQISNEINNGIELGAWNSIYSNSKNSVINIFCVSTVGNMVSISTGSGVVISANGVVLTNAHVAENFLIPNKECLIRKGEIAIDKYKASLVYINESWLQKNAQVLFSQGARGTGENDFALLSINSDTDNSKVGSDIPHTNINSNELTEGNKGNRILVAGYPAGTLGALSLRKYLAFSSDIINISNVFTLDGSHVDIIETDATKVGQHGSSGGGIFDSNNNLIGLIVSINDESGNSKMNALALPYINRAIRNDTGKSLQEFINTDKSSLLSSFSQKQNTLYGYVRPYVQ